jgi:phospholipid N-methyltransferase
VAVAQGYAQDLPAILDEWGHARIDRIVSGLPWAAWGDEIQDPIFDAILATLAPDGRMVTFAYLGAHMMPAARRLKQKLQARFERVSKSPTVLANVPPAFVYICENPR